MNRRIFLAGAASAIFASAAIAAETRMVLPRAFYNKDLSLSDYAKSLEGQRIAVTGFMAPLIKAESSFFVMTNRPMAACPFCETEAQWPDDILAIYTKRTVDAVPYNAKIMTRGRLALGTYEDPDTGFLSRVRLLDSTFERM